MDKPDLYDPQINRSYARLASHYATGHWPAPENQDKPRVERPMTYVRDSFRKGRGSDSLARYAAGGGHLEHRSGRASVLYVPWRPSLRMFRSCGATSVDRIATRAFRLWLVDQHPSGWTRHLKLARHSIPCRGG